MTQYTAYCYECSQFTHKKLPQFEFGIDSTCEHCDAKILLQSFKGSPEFLQWLKDNCKIVYLSPHSRIEHDSKEGKDFMEKLLTEYENSIQL